MIDMILNTPLDVNFNSIRDSFWRKANGVILALLPFLIVSVSLKTPSEEILLSPFSNNLLKRRYRFYNKYYYNRFQIRKEKHGNFYIKSNILVNTW